MGGRVLVNIMELSNYRYELRPIRLTDCLVVLVRWFPFLYCLAHPGYVVCLDMWDGVKFPWWINLLSMLVDVDCVFIFICQSLGWKSDEALWRLLGFVIVVVRVVRSWVFGWFMFFCLWKLGSGWLAGLSWGVLRSSFARICANLGEYWIICDSVCY